MISSIGRCLSVVGLALGVCWVAGSSHAHADPCKNGYRLHSSGVCVSERDIEISCDSAVADGEEYQLALAPHSGRSVYCFKNVGGDQSNIVFGQVVRSGGCLYQHPQVNGRGGSAVSLDFCQAGPRDVFLQALPDIVCEEFRGEASATCHRFYRP
jgi:hypothetical protein